MAFEFGKYTARICAEQIIGRLRQYIKDLPEDKILTVDEFAERITFYFLDELTELKLPIDPQMVIAAAMGMVHACMQTIAAAEAEAKPNTTAIVWDDVVLH